MITLPLRIRYSQQPTRPAAAWLIPGEDSRTWLAELLEWQTPLAEAALYVVPRSAANLSPQGVLVIAPEGALPQVSRRCQPYARIGGHGKAATIYVPINARFDPDAADAEITRLLSSTENIYLWHPACGLVGFEPGDRRRVADLLQAPPQGRCSWQMARPGTSFSRRLTAIEPDWTPSAEAVLDAGQGDIGSQVSSLDELPPSPAEPPASPLARMTAAIKQRLADLLKKAEKPPEGSDRAKLAEDAADRPADDLGCIVEAGPGQDPGQATAAEFASADAPGDADSQSAVARNGRGGLGRLAAGLLGAAAGMARAAARGLAGAKQRLSKLGQWLGKGPQPGRVPGRSHEPARRDEKLLGKRHRELLRLVHALDKDPDLGLRYAIPLHSAGRDAGRPGAKLTHRDVDFNLARLGGQPFDHWHVPQHVQQQLLAKYHDLAGRELRLVLCPD